MAGCGLFYGSRAIRFKAVDVGNPAAAETLHSGKRRHGVTGTSRLYSLCVFFMFFNNWIKAIPFWGTQILAIPTNVNWHEPCFRSRLKRTSAMWCPRPYRPLLPVFCFHHVFWKVECGCQEYSSKVFQTMPHVYPVALTCTDMDLAFDIKSSRRN